jgi:hypothetical protein
MLAYWSLYCILTIHIFNALFRSNYISLRASILSIVNSKVSTEIRKWTIRFQAAWKSTHLRSFVVGSKRHPVLPVAWLNGAIGSCNISYNDVITDYDVVKSSSRRECQDLSDPEVAFAASRLKFKVSHNLKCLSFALPTCLCQETHTCLSLLLKCVRFAIK